MKRILSTIAFALCFSLASTASALAAPMSPRAERVITNIEGQLKQELNNAGLRYGAPIFMRIFKDPGRLEVWVETDSGRYQHFKDYEICRFSGDLGPKRQTGDLQSPEGFYEVSASSLNPWSRFHLSFDIGYPNAYDRYHGRTGNHLMVHGECRSEGCFAMTNQRMDEIYTLAFAALTHGQKAFPVHSFPFPMDDERLANKHQHEWFDFWSNLKEGYDYFERFQTPPRVRMWRGRYWFGAS